MLLSLGDTPQKRSVPLFGGVSLLQIGLRQSFNQLDFFPLPAYLFSVIALLLIEAFIPAKDAVKETEEERKCGQQPAEEHPWISETKHSII